MFKSVAGFKSVKHSLKWPKQSQLTYVLAQMPPKIWASSYYLYSRCSVCTPFASKWTQLSTLHLTEARILSKIPGLTWILWQAFSTRCRNNFQSLIGSGYTKVFSCPHPTPHPQIPRIMLRDLFRPAPPTLHLKSDLGALRHAKKSRWCPFTNKPHVSSFKNRHILIT